MNGFEMLTGPLAQSIGWALVHLLWQGAVIAALLAAVLALMEKRSANARYIAACSALALLLVCGIATAYRAYEPPLTPVAPPASVAGAVRIDFADSASPALPVGTRTSQAATIDWLPLLRSALPTIVMIWLAGVVLLSLRLLVTWLRTMRMAGRDALDAEAPWQRTLSRLAAGLALTRAVRLVESAAVEVPTVIGWMRPVILLPLSSLSGLSAEQVEMVLAHELAHIRRHDFLVNLLQAVVETLLFYHPAVWWMSKRVRVERENCCDDLAVAVCGNPLQYARALARLEELRAGDVQVALAANGGSLLDRVRRLVGAGSDGAGMTSRWIAGAGVLTLLVAFIAFPSLPLLAQREAKAAPAPAPAPAKAAQAQVEVRAEAAAAAEADADTGDGTETDADSDSGPDDDAHADADDPQSDDDDDDDAVDANDVDFTIMAPPFPPGPGVPPSPLAPPAPGAPLAPLAPMTPAIRVAPHNGTIVLDKHLLRQRVAEAMAEERGEARHGRPHRPLGADGKLSVDDLITLSTVGVTPEYVGQMRAAFGDSLTLDDVVAMRVQGVSTDWLRAMREAGVDIRNGSDAVALAVQGVQPELVKALTAAGYTNLSVRDLVRLAVSGVNPDYIREMSKFHANGKK